MNPSITVAVPTCNGARHLRAALSSILRSETPHDLIIVDDRSDDETLTIARELVGDRGRIVVNSERLGLAKNWNRCVALSQTPLVAIFHQDDVMLPGHLEAHLEVYRKARTCGWIASAADVIDDSGDPVPESVVERGKMAAINIVFDATDGIAGLVPANPLRCSGVTINTAAHAEVGGFDPSYRYVVDWDFWIRVAWVRPVAWCARPTVAIRWHPSSETHRFAHGMADLDETTRLLDTLALRLPFPSTPAQNWRQLADRRLARAFLNRAYVAFKQGDLALARRALLRSLRLAPRSSAKDLLLDPRLLAQMATAVIAPRWARRPNQTAVSGEGVLPDRLESGDND